MLNSRQLIEKLVPVFTDTINNDPTMVCDARDLHAYLESKQEFANWIKNRIEKYGFEANIDYLQVIDFNARQNYQALKSKSYGQGRIDYHLTLNMAKELGMVDNTAKGREVRRYFIYMEEQARNPKPTAATAQAMQTLQDSAVLQQLLYTNIEKVVTLTNQVQTLEAQAKEYELKAKALDRLSAAPGCMCITDAAKALKTTPDELFFILRHMKWIYRRNKRKNWLGYQDKLDDGLLMHKVYSRAYEGFNSVATQVMITIPGLIQLSQLFPNEDLDLPTVQENN